MMRHARWILGVACLLVASVPRTAPAKACCCTPTRMAAGAPMSCCGGGHGQASHQTPAHDGCKVIVCCPAAVFLAADGLTLRAPNAAVGVEAPVYARTTRVRAAPPFKVPLA